MQRGPTAPIITVATDCKHSVLVLSAQTDSPAQAHSDPFEYVKPFFIFYFFFYFLELNAARMSEELMADVVGETFCIFRQPLIKTLCMSRDQIIRCHLKAVRRRGGGKYTKILKAALLIFI